VLRDRRGVTAVEFAVLGAIFITLLFGTVEVSRYVTTAQSLRGLTADAARAALISVNGTLSGTACGSATVSWETLLERTPMLTLSGLTRSVDTDCTARTVTVTASYGFTPVITFLPVTTITHAATLDFF
jgi:Flp pilus assembly protein TadG